MSEKPEKNVKPTWVMKREFAASTQMKELLKSTIAAAQAELEATRRKLKKLTYGS